MNHTADSSSKARQSDRQFLEPEQSNSLSRFSIQGERDWCFLVTSAGWGNFAVSLMGADRNQGAWGVWSHKLLITKTTMALALTVASRGYEATTEHLVLRAYSLLEPKKIFPPKGKKINKHNLTKLCYSLQMAADSELLRDDLDLQSFRNEVVDLSETRVTSEGSKHVHCTSFPMVRGSQLQCPPVNSTTGHHLPWP